MSDTKETKESDLCYAVIHNIPKSFRTKNLRAFFSLFVEEKRFDCFHFRHRPELKLSKKDSISIADTPGSSKKGETCCCLIRLSVKNRQLFIKRYSNEHWTNEFGNDFGHLKCFVTPIKLDSLNQMDDGESKDAKNLIEFNPPPLMPQGNVGTPSEFFLDLIRQCRLPSSLIGKLGLNFVRSANGRRTYGNVPMNYDIKSKNKKTDEVDEEEIARRQNPPDADEGSDLDDDNCQEFERHEALNDDVTGHERNKERQYEEEMEVVWEKGGPGLVFYTDSFFWEQEKGTDTDELWADDWDVDMGVYYGDGGSKDSKDLLTIRQETMFRSGKLAESVFEKRKIHPDRSRLAKNSDTSDTPQGSFEKFSKGVARKVMERHGWRQGTSLGKTFEGKLIPAAVEMEADALAPYSRKGIGYRGEKLQRFNLDKTKTKRTITTIYDTPGFEDPPEILTRRHESTHNKWRPKKTKIMN